MFALTKSAGLLALMNEFLRELVFQSIVFNGFRDSAATHLSSTVTLKSFYSERFKLLNTQKNHRKEYCQQKPKEYAIRL